MSRTAPTALPHRNRLLSSCAVAVIATLTVHVPVRAQSAPPPLAPGGFQGAVNGSTGVLTPEITDFSTKITVDADRAIINWTPNDNRTGTAEAINFLPVGRSAEFVNNAENGVGDYIVFNRILPTDNTRAIQFNGTVTSTVNGGKGGQVWFYSPSGLIVGEGASFNVGSLLLTSRDISNEDFLDGNDSFSFGAATIGAEANPRAAVEVQGSISAGARNAYVALIAPRVLQSGNVTVNGSAAYVAAEKVAMTISGSLFDIQVAADGGSSFNGSRSDDAALVHEGTTTLQNNEVGPNDVGYGTTPTARTAIMVAVPKNDAVTMLVQGNVAYEPASQASVDGGRIILSGGNNVRANEFFQTNNFEAIDGVTGKADIRISNAAGRSRFATNVDAQATGLASVTAIGRGETGYGGAPLDDLAFGGSLDLEGFGGASVEALAGSRIDIAASLNIDASGRDASSSARASLIARAGADIDVGQSAVGDNINRFASIEAELSASATGGAVNLRTAEILAEGGRIDFASDVYMSATANAGSRSTAVDTEGGTAKVVASGRGIINVGVDTSGGLYLNAGASGGGSSSEQGGQGKGGTASVESGAGSLIKTGGQMFVEANGEGGFGGAVKAGDGIGGIVSVLAAGGAIEVGDGLTLQSNGFGGFTFDSDVGYGTGQGKSATLGISTVGTAVGRISVDTLLVEANGSGGFFGGEGGLFALAAEEDGGSGSGGGDGIGGIVTASIDGVLAPITTEGSVSIELSADGSASSGAGGDSEIPPTPGGDGVGGTVSIDFKSGTTSLARLDLSAEGSGGDGGSNFSSGGTGADGGIGDGGSITVRSTGGTATIGSIDIDAEGDGGRGGRGGDGVGENSAGNGGKGGLGIGGNLTISATSGSSLTIPAGDVEIGGDGGSGGDGGTSSNANGGAGGRGGDARGGSVTLEVRDATLTIASDENDGEGTTFFEEFELEAGAAGGRGGSGGSGGFSGRGGNGGRGGDALGGTDTDGVPVGGAVTFTLAGNASLIQTSTGLLLSAESRGGRGGSGATGGLPGAMAGAGGNAEGGVVTLAFSANNATINDLRVVSDAAGGFGGLAEAGYGGPSAIGANGGSAKGGIITLNVTAGTTNLAPATRFSADAIGGSGSRSANFAGGNGGSATGGNVSVAANGTGSLVAPGLLLSGSGEGGIGGDGGDARTGGAGGNGGDGRGGTVEVAARAGGTIGVEGAGEGEGLILRANGQGGSGGGGGDGSEVGDTGGRGGNGGNGNGGNDLGGTARLTIAGGTARLSFVELTANGQSGNGGLGGTGAGRAAVADNPATLDVDESAPEIPATPAANGASGGGRGGLVELSVADAVSNQAGSLSAGETILVANGSGPLAESGLARITDRAAAEGSLRLGSLSAETFGGGAADQIGFELLTDSGAIDVVGGLDVRTSVGATFAGLNGGSVKVGDTASIEVDGTLGLTQETGATAFLIQAGDITIAAGAVSGASAGISARNDVDVTAAGSAQLGRIRAGDDIRINAASASIGSAFTDGSGSDDEEDGSNLVVTASGAIGVTDADVADDIVLASSGGSIASGGLLKAGGSISAEAPGAISIRSATAGGDIELDSFESSVSSLGTLAAGDDVTVNADGDVALTNVTAGDSIFISGAGVGLTGSATAVNLIRVNGTGVALGDLTTTTTQVGVEVSNGIRVSSQGLATMRSANSGTVVLVTSQKFSGGSITAGTLARVEAFGNNGFDGTITVGNVKAGTVAELAGFGTVTATGIDAGTDAIVRSQTGGANVGTGKAGRDLRMSGQSIGLAGGTAGRDIILNARGDIVVTSAQAGDDFRATSSNGAVTAATVVTTGLGPDTNETGYGADGSNIFVQANTDARLDNGRAPGAISLRSTTGSVRSAGLLKARRLTTSQGLDVALTDVDVTEALFLNAGGGSISGRDFRSGRGISLVAAGDIDLDAATASGGDIFAQAQDISLGEATAMRSPFGGEGNIIAFGSGAVEIGAADAAGYIDVQGSSFTGSSLSAGEYIRAQVSSEGGGTGNIDVDAADAGDFIAFTANGAVDTGALTAGSDITLRGSTITLANGTAARDILLEATGAISVAMAQAGDDFVADSSGGSFTGGTIVTTGLGEDVTHFGGEGGSGEGDGSNILVEAASFVRLDNGNAPDRISLTAQNGRIDSSGLIKTTQFDASATGDITLTDVDVVNSLVLSASAGSISGRNFASDGDIRLDAGSAIRVAATDAGGSISLQAGTIEVGAAKAVRRIFASGGSVDLGSAVTTGAFSGEGGDGISVFASGEIDIGSAESATFLLAEGRNISGGALKAAREVTLNAFGGEGGGGNIDIDSAAAGTFMDLFASGGALKAGTLTAGTSIFGSATGNATVGEAAAGATFALGAGGAASVGTVKAGRDVAISGGSISLTSGTAGRDVDLQSGGAIAIGLAQGGDDVIVRSGSTVTADRLVTTGLGQDTTHGDSGYGEEGPGDGSNILVTAPGAIMVAEGNAKNQLRFASSQGSVTSTALVAGDDIRLEAATTAKAGSSAAGGSVLVDAAGIDLGKATATRSDVTLKASGNVSVQEARAGDDVSVMAGGTALVGAAAAPGTGTDGEGDGFNIRVQAVGNVSFGSADTVGNLRLVSENGGILRLGAPDGNLIQAGASVFVSSAFDLNLASVTAGRDIALASKSAIDTGSLNAGGALSLDAGGALSVDAAKAGGELLAKGSSIEFGSVEIGGALNLNTPGALVLGTARAASIAGSGSSVTAGTLTTGGSITLAASSGNAAVTTALAGTDIVISGTGVTLTDGTAGRDIRLDAAGNMNVGSAKAGDDFDAKAGGAFAGTTVVTTGLGPDGDGTSSGTVTQAGPDGSNIRVSAGSIALATGTAKDGISLTSSQGAISSDKALTAGGSILGKAATTMTLASAAAGQGIELAAAGAINGTALDAGTDLRLSGGNVTLGAATAGDDIDIAATGTTAIATATTTGKAADDGNNGSSLIVSSAGGISIAKVDSAGGANLRAENGAVLVSQDLKSARAVDALGRSVTLNAAGPLAVRSATATTGDVGLTSVGTLAVERADASGAVAASTAGTLALSGTVNGTQISLSSRDIAIGSTAQVGTTQRTTAIQITANGAGSPVVIGGGTAGSGYRLDNAEFARLAARDVSITSQGETAAMQIDALAVRGAGASNPNVTGRLSFAAAGDIEMTGKLALDGATDANSVRVSSGRGFFADAAGAGIAVTGSGGALTGAVDIGARSITIASRTAVTDLASATTIDARSDRLGQNDGSVDNGGFIRAGGVRLSASERIHVQNSGANSDSPDDRAGLSVGAGGITIVTNSLTTPVEIIINGRQSPASGAEITGESLIDELTILGVQGGEANFAARSTVNGCIIGASNCGVPVFENSPFTAERNVIEDLLDEQEDGLTRPPAIAFSRLISVEQGPLLPVVDEPVTGTGNEDIYMSGDALDPACQDDRQNCIIDDPVTGSGNEDRQSGNADGTPATTLERRPNGEVIDAPVTGTGNDTLEPGERQDD